MIEELNVRIKSTKHLEGNISVNPHDLGMFTV
jgi:hypothetical protein